MAQVANARSRRVKRWIDVAVAAAGLAILSPIMGITALAIRWRMGRPILFRQDRPGYRGKPFNLIKFRTLREASDKGDAPVPESDLSTRLGQFLRRTSLDELPQLWNILKGEMSLVGPRPLVMEYLIHYTPTQARRHEVPPGLTGWAQVNGRHDVNWEERFAYDVWYVDNWSLLLDLRIIVLTVRKVFSGAASTPPAVSDFGFTRPDDVSL